MSKMTEVLSSNLKKKNKKILVLKNYKEFIKICVVIHKNEGVLLRIKICIVRKRFVKSNWVDTNKKLNYGGMK